MININQKIRLIRKFKIKNKLKIINQNKINNIIHKINNQFKKFNTIQNYHKIIIHKIL